MLFRSYLNTGLQWYQLSDGRLLNVATLPDWVANTATAGSDLNGKSVLAPTGYVSSTAVLNGAVQTSQSNVSVGYRDDAVADISVSLSSVAVSGLVELLGVSGKIRVDESADLTSALSGGSGTYTTESKNGTYSYSASMMSGRFSPGASLDLGISWYVVDVFGKQEGATYSTSQRFSLSPWVNSKIGRAHV